jgi:hypothetical protein
MLGAASDGWDVLAPAPSHPCSTFGFITDDLPSILLAVRYIGPRRARRLLDALGDDWRDLLDTAPERVFRTLRGVGIVQARAAAQSWRHLSRGA